MSPPHHVLASQTMVQLFLSYRRADAAATSGRIFDRLAQRYGSYSVFRDVDSVPIGTDFRRQIEKAVSAADVVLVLIGPAGLFPAPRTGVVGDDGAPVDYVELEIECALKSDIPIIPVLLNGAVMPTHSELPARLRDFSYRQAACVDGDRRFEGNMATLIEAIDSAREQRRLEERKESPDPSISAISSLLALASQRRPSLEVRNVRTVPELRDLWKIDNEAYGNANVDFKLFREWWMAYPPGLQAVFSDEQVVGAVGLWPVPEYWMTGFRAGELAESDLSPQMIKQAAEAPCQFWYVSGIVLNERWKNTSAISVLLREAAITWALEAELKKPVTMLAMAISEQGERLLGRFGFALVTPNDATRDGFSLYARTVGRADLKTLVGLS